MMLLGSGAMAVDTMDSSNKREIDYQCKFKYELPKYGWVWCGVHGTIVVRNEDTEQTFNLRCKKDDVKVLSIYDEGARLTRDGLVLTLHGEDAKDQAQVRFLAPRELPATVDAALAINEDDFSRGACRFEEAHENGDGAN